MESMNDNKKYYSLLKTRMSDRRNIYRKRSIHDTLDTKEHLSVCSEEYSRKHNLSPLEARHWLEPHFQEGTRLGFAGLSLCWYATAQADKEREKVRYQYQWR